MQILPWLNNPVVAGNIIYEINYQGHLQYRLVEHYAKGFSAKFSLIDKVFNPILVVDGNRIAVQERYFRVRIIN